MKNIYSERMITSLYVNSIILVEKYIQEFVEEINGWLKMSLPNMRMNKYNKIQEQKVRYILPKNDGEISNSITRNWTDQAIRCYTSEFNCLECSIAKGNYSFVCQMKSVIKILLEHVGPPDDDKVGKLPA